MSWSDRFASFDGEAYLDVAAQGPLPLAASRAGREALALQERPDRLADGLLLALPGEVRALYARLFACQEDSVALVTGAGAVVSAVARGLELGEGDEVVLPRDELPANAYPWLWLRRRGARIVEVDPDPATGAVSGERLASRVGARTRAVAFSHVSHLHGGRIDPTPIVDAARRVGAVTVVDGSQAAGALPFDFGASGVDAYAACASRFLLGPGGTAVGLFSPGLLARLGVGDLNWRAVKGSEDPDGLPRGELDLRSGAVRYEAHGAPSLVHLMPLAESLRLVLEATPAAVQAHCREIGDRILERLPQGFRAASPLEPAARSHVLCVSAETPEATRAAHERLLAARVRVSHRSGRLRIGPHLHASAADADRLVAALAPGA